MTAVQYEIFDDLLIGNFMKTTMHGKWGPMKLYPDFSPYLVKCGDNGRAKSDRQVAVDMESYWKRETADYLKHSFFASDWVANLGSPVS